MQVVHPSVEQECVKERERVSQKRTKINGSGSEI
jgi:hypothetical protein